MSSKQTITLEVKVDKIIGEVLDSLVETLRKIADLVPEAKHREAVLLIEAWESKVFRTIEDEDLQ